MRFMLWLSWFVLRVYDLGFDGCRVFVQEMQCLILYSNFK